MTEALRRFGSDVRGCYSTRNVAWQVLAVALYIGIGISTNIHWFSEFVAGAIIGSVIGSIIGKRISEYTTPI